MLGQWASDGKIDPNRTLAATLLGAGVSAAPQAIPSIMSRIAKSKPKGAPDTVGTLFDPPPDLLPPVVDAPGVLPPVVDAPGVLPPVVGAPGVLPPVVDAPGVLPPVVDAPREVLQGSVDNASPPDAGWVDFLAPYRNDPSYTVASTYPAGFDGLDGLQKEMYKAGDGHIVATLSFSKMDADAAIASEDLVRRFGVTRTGALLTEYINTLPRDATTVQHAFSEMIAGQYLHQNSGHYTIADATWLQEALFRLRTPSAQKLAASGGGWNPYTPKAIEDSTVPVASEEEALSIAQALQEHKMGLLTEAEALPEPEVVAPPPVEIDPRPVDPGSGISKEQYDTLEELVEALVANMSLRAFKKAMKSLTQEQIDELGLRNDC